MSAVYHNDKLIVCGGENFGPINKKCWTYNNTSNGWDLFTTMKFEHARYVLKKKMAVLKKY
jgi:hypothetical protein